MIQEGMLTPTAQHAACETWNTHPIPSYCGLVPLGPNFTGTESSPAKMLIGLPFDRQLIALQLCRWEFLDMKLCSRLLMFFDRDFCQATFTASCKNSNYIILYLLVSPAKLK